MSISTRACGLVAAATLCSAHAAHAAVVWETDFNIATAGAVGTAATTFVVNSGGTTTDDVNVRSNTDSAVTLVNRGGSNLAMQFLDNSSDGTLTGNPRAYSSIFGPLSTTNSGDNRLSGSFTYTRLVSTAGNATNGLPAFVFLASSGGQILIDSATNAIKFSVESDGRVHYVSGGPTVGHDSGFTLVTGTEYRFAVDTDFSSTGTGAQDKWRLTVTPVGSTTSVVDTGWINTWAANVAVNTISMLGGANQTATNTSPFAQIDNISFSAQAVPEPTSLGLLAGCSGLLLQRRKQRTH